MVFPVASLLNNEIKMEYHYDWPVEFPMGDENRGRISLNLHKHEYSSDIWGFSSSKYSEQYYLNNDYTINIWKDMFFPSEDSDSIDLTL